MAKATHTATLLAGEKIAEDSTGQVVSAEREYQVIEAFAASPATAMAAAGLPASGAVHPVYPSLKVSERSPVMQKDGIVWIISVSYKPGAGLDNNAETFKTLKIEYGTHAIQVDVTNDYADGLPVLDGAGMPFDQVVQDTVEYPFIRITRQQKQIQRSTILDVSGTINQNDVVVAGVLIGRHKGKIKITATETTDLTFPWNVSFEVMVKSNIIKNWVYNQTTEIQVGPNDIGWDLGIINKGFFYKSATALNGRARCMEETVDSLGVPTGKLKPSAAPMLLRATGEVMTSITETPVIVVVQSIREADWAPLNLASV